MMRSASMLRSCLVRFAALIVAAMLLAVFPTAALPREPGTDCMQGDDAVARIKACTAVVQGSVRLSSADRAKFFGYRGWAHAQNGDLKAALADYDVSIALDPSSFGAWGSRASIQQRLGEFDKALADIDRSIQLAPAGFAPARAVRGDILRAKGDADGALREYDRALKIDPTDVGSLSSRSTANRIAGRFKEAEADLLRAIAIDPRIAELYTAQGQLAESMQDLAKAKDAYARALALPRSIRLTGKPGSPVMDATRAQATARARLAVLDAPTAGGLAVTAGAAPRKLALVIGNGSYGAVTALPNPPRDARLLVQQLREIGFETAEGIDLTHAEMRQRIDAFLLKAPSASIALIYYAGHGVQIDGKNYLVPVDANLRDGRQSIGELIDLDFIMAGLDDRLRANVIMLDACRNNPFEPTATQQADKGRSLVVRSGLAPQAGLSTGGTQGAGTLLAFATAPGQIALDGAGSNSPFTSALGRHITTPGLELQQMLTRVRSEVVAATGGKQVPWSNSSLLGEVYLTAR